MTFSHRAVFSYDAAENVWLAEFPDLPGCQTYGTTLEDARANALEALQVWLDADDVSVTEDLQARSTAN